MTTCSRRRWRRARIAVAGDADLLALGRYQGVDNVSVRAFLDQL